jgi:hypothetical protein
MGQQTKFVQLIIDKAAGAKIKEQVDPSQDDYNPGQRPTQAGVIKD